MRLNETGNDSRLLFAVLNSEKELQKALQPHGILNTGDLVVDKLTVCAEVESGRRLSEHPPFSYPLQVWRRYQ